MDETQLNPKRTLHCMCRKEGKRVRHIVESGFVRKHGLNDYWFSTYNTPTTKQDSSSVGQANHKPFGVTKQTPTRVRVLTEFCLVCGQKAVVDEKKRLKGRSVAP